MNRSAFILLPLFILVSCASETPHVVQVSADAPDISLTKGMATQVEMPEGERVQSVVTGNPSIVTAEKADNVVNLVPGSNSGETNLIVRALDRDNHSKVYQYRIIVQ